MSWIGQQGPVPGEVLQRRKITPNPEDQMVPVHGDGYPGKQRPVQLLWEGGLRPIPGQTNLRAGQGSSPRDASTLQDWGPHPELCLPGAQERDSGLYWCRATLEGGVAQKQSPQLEVRVQVPVSQPLLTLRPGPTGLAVGAMVELLCEAQKGSPPISYLFYLDGKILGNISSPYGRATCFPVTVTSERDAIYSCRAENYVSGETSEPKILSLDDPHWLVAGLSASLLGVLVIATALLACFRPWRKAESLPSQNLPPVPGGEQDLLYGEVRWQNENEDDDYSIVYATSRKSKAGPAASASGTQDSSVIYTEVAQSQLGELPAAKRNPRSRTHKALPGHFEEVLHY
ncbi:Fc receptor-like protein 6 [Prionailurus iriomotensis]